MLSLICWSSATAAEDLRRNTVWDLRLGHTTLWLKMGEVFLPMLAASLIYFGLSFWLKVPFAHDLMRLVLRKRAARQ